MVFDELHDVLSGSNHKEFLVISLRILFIDVKVRFGVMVPSVFDIVEIFLDLQLFEGVVGELQDLLFMLEEIEGHHLFESELVTGFIEVILDLKSELLPMSFSHEVLFEGVNKWHSCLELVDVIFEKFENLPLLDIFVLSSALLLIFNGLVFHNIYFEIIKSDVLPEFSLLVPLIFDHPKVGKLFDFCFDELNLWVAHWFNIEDLQTEFHGFFLGSKVGSETLELFEFIEGNRVVLRSLWIDFIWGLSNEVSLVVLALFFEVLNGAVDLLLKLGVALLDDHVGLIESLKEFFPLGIEAFEFSFVFFAQLGTTDILILFLDKLELSLDWISPSLKKRKLLSDLSIEIFVGFKMIKLSGLLLESLDGIGELKKQLVEVVLGFFDEMFKNLLDEVITVLGQTVLEFGAVQDNELLWLLWLLVFDIIHNINKTFDGFFVSLNRVLVNVSLISSQNTFHSSFSTNILKLPNLFGCLPMLSVLLHVILNLVDSNNNLSLLLVDFLVSGDLLHILGSRFKFSWELPLGFPLHLFLLL